MSTTLPLFWHLSSASKKERIDASVKLVSALEQFQSQFVPKPPPSTSGSENEEDEEDRFGRSDGLDLLNAQDVSYSIRRLVRGLASPRESSRLGFAVALTELLSKIDTVTCSQIYSLIMDSSKPQGSMTGQEERDMFFARLFGFMSVIRSGLIVRTTPLVTSASSATAASSLTNYEEIIKELLVLGEKKSWLRESAWFAISLAIDFLEGSEVIWKKDAIDSTIQQIFTENPVWSPEKVALALKLQASHPQREWQKLFSPTFKNSDLLSSANLQTLSRILKESTTDDEGHKDPTKAPSGSWKPQLHFVWDIILDQLLPGPNNTKSTKGSFQEFFCVVVDESLFSSTSSPQRKYWGFQVFQKALKRVNRDSLPTLFTKNFMRSWINHLSNRDRYLHKMAQQTVTAVQEFVKDKPQLGFALIFQLTGVNGSQQFDKLTKTKTVESILTSMDVEGIQNYIDYLFNQVNESDPDNSNIADLNMRRSWVIDQLSALIRNGGIPKADLWIQSILDWLVIHGLFVIKKKSSKSSTIALHSVPKPPFSDELRLNCRNRLFVCLADLNAQTTVVKSDDKATKSVAVASDGEFWIAKVFTTIQNLERDSKHVSFIVEVDEEEQTLRQNAWKLITKLRMVVDENREPARGAELLLLATMLQQYCNDDDDQASESLESSIESISRMPFVKTKPKKSDKEVSQGETLHEPVDVLVDTIIGFLEKSTAFIRTVANQVFGLLSSSVKESTIDLIITQLERRLPSELADQEDEEMEGEGSSDGNEDEKEKETGTLSEESEDDSFAEYDLGDDSNDEELDEELRNKIEEALRINGIEPATGETDDEDEDEELIDDDQMMAIDEQLAQVFRSRANEKKGGKNVNTQREATHFKNRVLDLLDIFFKKQPTNQLVLNLIIPLVELIGGSGQDELQLVDKAKGILRLRVGKAKEFPSPVEAQEVVKIATALHNQARKAHTPDLLAILSSCNTYLAKILIQIGAEDSVDDLYRQSLVDFFTRKNSPLNSSFFKDFFRRSPVQGWRLRKDLLELSSKAINGYRQSQALQLLEVLVNLLHISGIREKEIAEFMPQLRTTLLELATTSCSDKPVLTAPQMKELFKLALVSVRQTKRVIPEASEDVWQPSSWTSLHLKLTESSRFKSSSALHKMCGQIVRLSQNAKSNGEGKPSKAKRKAEEIVDSEGKSKTKTKTKRLKVKP